MKDGNLRAVCMTEQREEVTLTLSFQRSESNETQKSKVDGMVIPGGTH